MVDEANFDSSATLTDAVASIPTPSGGITLDTALAGFARVIEVGMQFEKLNGALVDENRALYNAKRRERNARINAEDNARRQSELVDQIAESHADFQAKYTALVGVGQQAKELMLRIINDHHDSPDLLVFTTDMQRWIDQFEEETQFDESGPDSYHPAVLPPTPTTYRERHQDEPTDG